MKLSNISFKIASWILMIGGLGHSTAELFSPKTAEQIEITVKMAEWNANILGSEISIYSLYLGFSLMMGLLTFGYGAINLLILNNSPQTQLPSNIIVLNIIITLISTLLSIKYFFIVPILLTGIPFLGFLISLITKNRKS